MTQRISSRSANLPNMIARCENFTTYGALRGAWERAVSGGQLPTHWWEQLHRDLRDSESAYVVYSYSTPIAWYTTAYGWRVPDVRYSVTTSRHQGRLYRVTAPAA